MPVHNWMRVDAGVFHDFHLMWVCGLSRFFNSGGLPVWCYSLLEPVSDESAFLTSVDSADEDEIYFRRRRVVRIRSERNDGPLASVQIVPPGAKHRTAWMQTLTHTITNDLSHGLGCLVIDLFQSPLRIPDDPRLSIATCGTGEVLADLGLYLASDVSVVVPLEATYQAAWAEVPRRWQQVLEPVVGAS